MTLPIAKTTKPTTTVANKINNSVEASSSSNLKYLKY